MFLSRPIGHLTVTYRFYCVDYSSTKYFFVCRSKSQLVIFKFSRSNIEGGRLCSMHHLHRDGTFTTYQELDELFIQGKGKIMRTAEAGTKNDPLTE